VIFSLPRLVFGKQSLEHGFAALIVHRVGEARKICAGPARFRPFMSFYSRLPGIAVFGERVALGRTRLSGTGAGPGLGLKTEQKSRSVPVYSPLPARSVGPGRAGPESLSSLFLDRNSPPPHGILETVEYPSAVEDWSA
jgi:hypothetical protein